MIKYLKKAYWKVVIIVGFAMTSPMVALADETGQAKAFLNNILTFGMACAGILAGIFFILGLVDYAGKGEQAGSSASKSGKGKMLAAGGLAVGAVAVRAVIAMIQSFWPA